jgi:hypothetical protein
LLAGCGSSGRSPAAVVEADRFVTAPFAAASSMRIDGVLDEPVWRDVKPVALSRAADATARSAPEQAIAKLVWTESHVIVGVTCTDADVIAESDADQEFHYKFGDVVEVFLKPERQSWYWELYGTPKGKRTRFFYP